ncbi:hypothetical protein NUW54_g14733 [Trametes sanguinea]|uniref:Uncharacterized protein n=1 Tax=Trametes sanguinea TaxID=158606 RepID=A0ACC1MCJ4_9APHY|nr:hypothetical protein NUW54_g14733 [Trametes sanguinea]
MPASGRPEEEFDLTIIDQKQDPRPTSNRDKLVNPDDDRDSNDSDDTVTDTDSEDEFDWEAEDDAKSQMAAASIKARRGYAVYRAFMKLPKVIRVLLVGGIGAAILITPLLVVNLRFNTSVVKAQVHVWSLWLAITWAAGVATFVVVDAIPHLVLVVLRIITEAVEIEKEFLTGAKRCRCRSSA